MGNSSLVNYTKLSPNHSGKRKHVIDTITIHCYVGQASVEDMGAWFVLPSTEASCNYGIGKDGRIALIVDEDNVSWCSSNQSNDQRAVTIECACNKTKPYAINDKVYASLIQLCADICRRNGIKELKWKADPSLVGQVDKQNMTAHRWFKNKECPGDYIYERLGQIAKEVNALLNVEGSITVTTPSVATPEVAEEPYLVKVSVPNLNIRMAPDVNSQRRGTYTGVGVFTIVKTKPGPGSVKGWGLLKSYAAGENGWISLDFAEYLRKA